MNSGHHVRRLDDVGEVAFDVYCVGLRGFNLRLVLNLDLGLSAADVGLLFFANRVVKGDVASARLVVGRLLKVRFCE